MHSWRWYSDTACAPTWVHLYPHAEESVQVSAWLHAPNSHECRHQSDSTVRNNYQPVQQNSVTDHLQLEAKYRVAQNKPDYSTFQTSLQKFALNNATGQNSTVLIIVTSFWIRVYYQIFRSCLVITLLLNRMVRQFTTNCCVFASSCARICGSRKLGAE